MLAEDSSKRCNKCATDNDCRNTPGGILRKRDSCNANAQYDAKRAADRAMRAVPGLSMERGNIAGNRRHTDATTLTHKQYPVHKHRPYTVQSERRRNAQKQ